MGLLDEAEAKSGRSYSCRYATVRSELSDADAAELDAAMARPTVSLRAIGDVLRARGARISTTSLHNHRQGRCACRL